LKFTITPRWDAVLDFTVLRVQLGRIRYPVLAAPLAQAPSRRARRCVKSSSCNTMKCVVLPASANRASNSPPCRIYRIATRHHSARSTAWISPGLSSAPHPPPGLYSCSRPRPTASLRAVRISRYAQHIRLLTLLGFSQAAVLRLAFFFPMPLRLSLPMATPVARCMRHTLPDS
jgi:hypothetical protein